MRTLEISEETYEKIKDQLLVDETVDLSSMEDMVGKSFFFRTVTYHFIGKVKRVMGKFVQLEGAAWVADSGRFMNAIKEGTLNEVEPLGNWNINMDTVTDFGIWKHELPKNQK